MRRRSGTEVTERLGLRLPIVQGPFGGGLSTPRLVAAVSNAGGLGSYGAFTLGPDEIGAVTREIRALTAQPFALNLWVSNHDEGGGVLDQATFDRLWPTYRPYFDELGLPRPEPPGRLHQRFEDQVEAVLAARPAVFSFIFGVPSGPILAECRRRQIVTLGCATTLAEARALEEAGVDMIVASGFEAGGHRPSFLGGAEESLTGTFVLTQLITRRVQVPVIAAGGIADAAGVRAAFTLGAQGAQIGTAFLACEESGTSAAHRQLLLGAAAEQTVLSRGFTGRLARSLRNRWAEESAGRGALAPFPVPSWFLSQLRPAAERAGRTDLVTLWGGQIAPNLRHRHAADLLAELASELSG